MEPNWKIEYSTCLGTYTPDEDECGLRFIRIDQEVEFKMWLNREEVEELVARLNNWLTNTRAMWADENDETLAQQEEES